MGKRWREGYEAEEEKEVEEEEVVEVEEERKCIKRRSRRTFKISF